MESFERQLELTGYTPAQALAVLRAAATAGVTARDLTSALRAVADRAKPVQGEPLDAREEAFLAEHGGLHLPPSARAPAGDDLTARRLASALAADREAVTVAEAAAALGSSPGAIRDRIRRRTLYGYRAGARWRLPRWQISHGAVLPHLADVLTALPPDAHPMTVTGFMTTPSAELEGRSPAQWLAEGGSPHRVLFAMSALTAW